MESDQLNVNSLIYGKNQLDRIVGIEPGDSTAEVFRELEDGTVTSVKVPCSHYILFADQLSEKFRRLSGNQHFKYIMEYNSWTKYDSVLSASYKKRVDLHVIRDPKEAIMVKDGYTYFKGMQVKDVSVLSFDLETTGLTHDNNSKVLLISNTFRRLGNVERKLFSLDEYPDQAAMLTAWCDWVREVNPSIMLGHYIINFDFPYLAYVADRCGIQLRLGRNNSKLRFASRSSQFRKDGSQAYEYVNVLIYGREIVDTKFLAMKYDVARNYETYSLKPIIKHEGLEKKGRVHYDASQIHKNWHDLEERKKIKAYAIDDADDALKLYDLMIPSFFYYTQTTPRSFQQIINTATGSQINSLMVRAYLQQGHSIAKASEAKPYEGAISFGVPGIHKNVFKIDVQSLYPSIILSSRLCNRNKDPQEVFIKLVDYFTQERIRNKEQGEKTGERYYKDLSESQKIAINSMYGFLGANRVNYNSPEDASMVTRIGREILQKAILWASGKEYVPVMDDKDEDNDAA